MPVLLPPRCPQCSTPMVEQPEKAHTRTIPGVAHERGKSNGEDTELVYRLVFRCGECPLELDEADERLELAWT